MSQLYMIHNITLIKWFHPPLILTSLKQTNVKDGDSVAQGWKTWWEPIGFEHTRECFRPS